MIQDNVEYKIKGYFGRWSCVDRSHGFCLMEHVIYGDETCYLVLRESLVEHLRKYRKKSDGSVVELLTLEPKKPIETHDDIETALRDNGIL